GWFQIDENSGVVSVKGNIDYDSADLTDHKATVSVKATSTDLSHTSKYFEIVITEADGTTPGGGDTDNAITKITDNDPASNEISENAKNGDEVGITALAIDPDADLVSYTLIDDAEGRFTIDASTGIITVADETKLDYEQWTSHSVEVKALSTDGSFVTKVFEIAVIDGDGSNPGEGDTDNAVQNLLDINANDNFIYEHTIEGYLVGITANATDSDGDKVIYSLSDDANARFAIDETSGVVSVNNTALIDYEKWTSHTITIKATSYDNSIIEGDFVIDVLPVNDAPTFVMDTLLQVKEDAGFKFKKGWAKDIKKGPASERNQKIEFTLTNDREDLFSKQPKIEKDGNLSFQPAKDVHGIATINVVLKDDGGTSEGGTDSSDKKSFKIEILDINDAPSFTKGANIELGEDAGEQKFNNWASDINVGPDNEGYQTWEFKIENSNTELFSKQPVIDSEGNLSFTIADEKSGLADLVVVMKDDGGLANGGIDISIKQRFTINVADFNDMPIANPDEYSLKEGETLSVNGEGVLVNDSDIDSDHLKAILKEGVMHGELSLEEDGSFVYKHDGSETTFDQFTYTVNDGDKDGNTVFVALVITAVNDAPLAQDDYAVVNEDEVLRGTNLLENDSDIDSDVLEINTTAIVDVAHGELTINEDGTYIYTPEANYFGEDSFQYEISDLGSPVQTATATVHLMVNQVKDAPLAYNKSITVFEGTQNNLLEIVEPFDPDGDDLTVHILHIPKFGEIAINGHAVQVGETISIEDLKLLVYNTKVNFVGDVYFEYQVSDIDNAMAVARVNIEVVPEDVFIPQTFTPNGDDENETFTIVGIEDYPNNKIEIFNRWGNTVYTKKRYDNSWDGFGNVKGRLTKSKLPSGTYYYVLSLGDGKKPVMGYIYMMY
ncbi:Ig-like domain-containing protein, partial [Labilibaculum sp. DW002]